MAPPTRSTPGHFDISSILRPSEKVSVSLPCRIRTDSLDFQKAEVASITSDGVGSSGQITEGAIIVVVPQTGSNIRIAHLMRVTEAFKYSLNQCPPSPSTSFFHQSSRPHITLSLSGGVELRISSSHTARVQEFISDVRRLQDLASQSYCSPALVCSWLNLYPIERPRRDDLSDNDVTLAESSAGSQLSLSSSTTSIQPIHTPMSAMNLTSVTPEDEEYPNPFVSTFRRTAFLRNRLFARQEKWSSRTPIRIRLITYNVNDKLPPPGTTELAPVVGAGEDDLLVVGLQEADLRGQALLYSQGNERVNEWEVAILRGLGDKSSEYERVATTQYVGVVTLVFVRKTLRDAISQIETSERGIGILGFGGNKAGVCVRLTIYDSTFAFVNSHLAAFATALDRRRADYQVLLKGLNFPQSTDVLHVAYDEFLPDHQARELGIDASHVLFWLGDLNYRIDMEDDILRAWVAESKWQHILRKDQLRSDIASGKSFRGFQEQDIGFAPSFKYVIGSSTLDARRSPAYTDRILYSLPPPATFHSAPTQITPLHYTSHEVYWSDHRPVSASFTVEARVVDEDKRREAFVGVERELDRLEELYRPSLAVESTSLEFGDVRCLRPEVREILLRNNGRVPALFSFRPPAPAKPICKTPLWPVPCCGSVDPGGEVRLKVGLYVGEEWSRKLTLGEGDLNDVLVLQVADGKDIFITVQATFLPTILGLPLALLTNLPSPVRDMPLGARKTLSSADPYTDPRVAKPVKEIWRCLEYLMALARPSASVWTDPVDAEDILDVIDCLDNNTEFGKDRANQVAGTVLALLEVLGGVLGSHNAESEQVTDRDEAFAVLERVGQVQTNILIGLMSVVKLVDSKADKVARVSADDAQGESDGFGGGAMAPSPLPLKVSATPQMALVDRLVPAVFGRLDGDIAGRRRFIRLLLEG